MMRAMKSREVLLSNSLFQVARLTFEGPDGNEIFYNRFATFVRGPIQGRSPDVRGTRR